jgi:hypothetical protein
MGLFKNANRPFEFSSITDDDVCPVCLETGVVSVTYKCSPSSPLSNPNDNARFFFSRFTHTPDMSFFFVDLFVFGKGGTKRREERENDGSHFG